ncbi:MAG: hypothetical protein KJ955_07820 [Nanoarchaeota archaeon]|nr:hypothetical protein [Nanoarchaeota archaeon]
MKAIKAITIGSAVLASIPAVLGEGFIEDGAEMLFGAGTESGIFIKIGLFVILFSFLMLGAKKAFPPEHQTAAMLVAFILALISMKFMPEVWIAGMGNVIWIAALALLPYAIVTIFIKDDVTPEGKLSKKKLIFTLLAYAVLIFSVLQVKKSPYWLRSMGMSGGYIEAWEDTTYWVSQRWWLLLLIALVVLFIIYLLSGSKRGEGGEGGAKPEKGPGLFDRWRERRHEQKMARLGGKQEKVKLKLEAKQARKAENRQARLERKAQKRQARLARKAERIAARRQRWHDRLGRAGDWLKHGTRNWWEAGKDKVKGAGRGILDWAAPERRLERARIRVEKQKAKLQKERLKQQRQQEKREAKQRRREAKGKGKPKPGEKASGFWERRRLARQERAERRRLNNLAREEGRLRGEKFRRSELEYERRQELERQRKEGMERPALESHEEYLRKEQEAKARLERGTQERRGIVKRLFGEKRVLTAEEKSRQKQELEEHLKKGEQEVERRTELAAQEARVQAERARAEQKALRQREESERMRREVAEKAAQHTEELARKAEKKREMAEKVARREARSVRRTETRAHIASKKGRK